MSLCFTISYSFCPFSLKALLWKNGVLPLNSQTSLEMHYSASMGGLQPASPLWNLPNRLETYWQSTFLSLKWVSVKARVYASWSERTQGPTVCGVYWLPVFALCKNSMKTLAPALSAGVWSYQAALRSTLGCIALSSILSLPDTHTQRMRGDSLPFCPEWSCLSLMHLQHGLSQIISHIETNFPKNNYYSFSLQGKKTNQKNLCYFKIPEHSCNWAEQNGPHIVCAWSFLFCDQFLANHYHGHSGCQRALSDEG